jgi:hypothetical protein
VLSPSIRANCCSRTAGVASEASWPFARPPADAGTQFRRRCLWRDDEEGDSRLRSQRAKGSAPGTLEEGCVYDHRPASGEQFPCQFVQPLVGEFTGLPGINASVDRRVAVASRRNTEQAPAFNIRTQAQRCRRLIAQ